MMQLKTFTFAVLFSSFLFGCVSVKLANTGAGASKATNISYKAPSKPFQSSKSSNSDKIWESSKTASTISYFSSCSDDEPSLKSIQTTSLQGLEDFKILDEQEIPFNERGALRSTIVGKLEGVPVQIEFIVFKKNSCSFHLTYVALKENYKKEIEEFNNFTRNFRVP
jgi:hypothetical protein